MSILNDPKFMDKVRAAGDRGDDALCDFLEGVTKVVQRENRARAKVQHAQQALEKYNRMARARGMPEKTSL